MVGRGESIYCLMISAIKRGWSRRWAELGREDGIGGIRRPLPKMCIVSIFATCAGKDCRAVQMRSALADNTGHDPENLKLLVAQVDGLHCGVRWLQPNSVGLDVEAL